MGADDFAAQLAKAAALSFQNGRSDAINEALKWATTHRDELKKAGLLESLLRMLGQ